MEMVSWKRRTAVLAAALLVMGAGCGDDDDDETASRCEARDQLETSVKALGDVDVTADGTDALRSAFDDVVDDVDQLADAVGSDLDDDVEKVKDQIGDVRTTLGSIGDQSLAGFVETLQTELGELADATTALVDAAGQDCD